MTARQVTGKWKEAVELPVNIVANEIFLLGFDDFDAMLCYQSR